MVVDRDGILFVLAEDLPRYFIEAKLIGSWNEYPGSRPLDREPVLTHDRATEEVSECGAQLRFGVVLDPVFEPDVLDHQIRVEELTVKRGREPWLERGPYLREFMIFDGHSYQAAVLRAQMSCGTALERGLCIADQLPLLAQLKALRLELLELEPERNNEGNHRQARDHCCQDAECLAGIAPPAP